MSLIAKQITKHKKLVMFIFFAAAAICAFLATQVKINTSMTAYLPDDSNTIIALDIMGEEFASGVPNAQVMVEDIELLQAVELKHQLEQVEGVSAVTWLDDVVDIKTPLEAVDSAITDQYYKNGAALFWLTIESGYEVSAVPLIRELAGEDAALTGDAVSTAFTDEMTRTEVTSAMLILLPLIIIILILFTSSWLEPLLFLITIGVAIVINMGLNVFAGEISSVNQTVGPILQLAVSLDYAIFLLHCFERKRKETEDINLAMQLAIKEASPSIAASAATTLFGFMALMFMEFKLGADLGMNLAKGIIISYLSVMVMLPALTLACHKLLDKTHHRRLAPTFSKAGNKLMKLRIPMLILALIVVVPCFLGQSQTSFIYGNGAADPSVKLGQDIIRVEEVFGNDNTMVLLVPRGEVAKEEALSKELEQLPHVNSVVSYANSVGTAIPSEYLSGDVLDNFYSANYARIVVYTDTSTEGALAFAVVESICSATTEYYDEFYYTGQSASLYDIKDVVLHDNQIVNLVAVIAIFAVLLLTFKSLTIPLVLLFTIETAIWVNLAIPYFMGNELSYIGYLILNTVQLGATIDYAILLTSNYTRLRKELPKRAAMRQTLNDNFSSILTSAMILSAAGFCLYFTSTNNIVCAIGLLLGRGTILSMLMVVFVAPALLLLFDKIIAKTTWRANFYSEDAQK